MDLQQQPGIPEGPWSVELAVCAEMVFLELPVVILFALYPGLVSLSQIAR